MITPARIAHIGWGLTGLGLILVALRLFEVFPPIGAVGIGIYMTGMTTLMTCILYRVCFVQIDKVSSWVLGLLGAVGTVGIWMALPIVFATLTPFVALLMLVCGALLMSVVLVISTRQRHAPHVVERGRLFAWPAEDMIASHYLWFILYGGVWLVGALSLVGGASSAAIETPWQSLPLFYLIAVAVGGVLSVLIMFSNIKTSIILLGITLQSLLMHAYIPASHVLPAGGDIWRHIGIVEHILDGNPINPVLFGSTATVSSIGGIVLPTVFVQPQQYAYSVQWGGMVLSQVTTDIPLLLVSRWSIPILFATTVPVLLFYIGVLLFRSSRHGLVLAVLSLVPFALLSQGSLTLPVTIGFMYLLFGLFLLCSALRYGTQMQWLLVALTALGMLFVYPLHAVLYLWCVFVGGILFALHGDVHMTKRRVWLVIATAIGICVLPVVELAAGYSQVPENISLVQSAKQMVGELSGWYIASAIRPHDILSGNILYNHLPEASFVPYLFTNIRWPLMVIMIGVMMCALYGWWRAMYDETRMSWQLLAVLTATVWGGYLISWYVLDGERQLVRRLDMVCAVLLVWFAWYGCIRLLDVGIHTAVAKRRMTIVVLIVGMCMWWGSMSAFTLGPDMRVMSTDEYTVGSYIAPQIEDDTRTCVLADTWVLLAVEAASAQAVIGGNFAMTAQYGQPERVALYDMARTAPTSTLVYDIAEVFDGEACVLVLPLDAPMIESYQQAFGVPTVVESFGVWRLELQKKSISSTIEQ